MVSGKIMVSIIALLLAVKTYATSDTIKTVKHGSGIPAALAGKWLNGAFSMSNWWSYDGKKYLGNPYTRSVAFNLSANGEAEFFLVIKTNTGYCNTEAFTYHKGTVKFDEAGQSFTFQTGKRKFPRILFLCLRKQF